MEMTVSRDQTEILKSIQEIKDTLSQNHSELVNKIAASAAATYALVPMVRELIEGTNESPVIMIISPPTALNGKDLLKNPRNSIDALVKHSFSVQCICEATLEPCGEPFVLTVPRAWVLAVASLMKAMSILLKVTTH